MIRLERDTNPPKITVYEIAIPKRKRKAGNAEKPISPAGKETEEAIRFFEDEANYKDNKKISKTDFKFKIYGDSELLSKLKEVCHNKCAYCESIFAHVSPADVEHYRPKSAINPFINRTDSKDLLKPGYYWLAADWNNLLISCIDCNRVRGQEIIDYPNPTVLVRQLKRNSGKGTRFPVTIVRHNIHGEDYQENPYQTGVYARTPTHDIHLEIPLLLNPFDTDSDRDPWKHLTFNDQGVIEARVSLNKTTSIFGVYTIETLGLYRKGLTDARAVVAKKFKAMLIELKEDTEFFATNPPKFGSAEENRLLEKYERLKRELKGYFDIEQPYIGMKRSILLQALTEWETLKDCKYLVKELAKFLY